ncbi:MAG: energy-coupling factor transporter ATPase [Mogibacterium sp.]|nr:energy-coupling factor transporter ATPase [Mogibacterium sp.]
MSIRAEHLKYIYNAGYPGETVALDDVSFEIPDGTFVGIIGHTGSGKSTLLQHLNGLLKPTEGKVYIDDVCITDPGVRMVDIRRRVGLVFQYPEYQLFEETVAKDVAFGPRNLGLSEEEIDRRVRGAMALVGLDYEALHDRSPFDLSGGQKRRVAIAGVIAMHPQVLILDEPTAGLDPAAHQDILDMIERVQREENIIIIYVSHNMADIARLSDRVLVMDHAKLVLEGTPAEVFGHRDYLHSIGLSVPPVMDIMSQLHEQDGRIDGGKMTPDEAAQEIARYLQQKR